MDVVKFGIYYYVFFVEANTRYLIAIPCSESLTESAYEEVSSRVTSDRFLAIFKQFQEMNLITESPRGMILRSWNQEKKPIAKVIGDSEKAFWSSTMRNYYRSQNIEYQIVNVSSEGHSKLSILDRLVRTIRDMIDNLKYDKDTSPPDMLRVVTIYNNTKHRSLKHTPKEVHNNYSLELAFTRRLRGDNWKTITDPNYLINPGEEVIVRRHYNRFEKKRSTTYPDRYRVVSRNEDGKYNLINSEGNEELKNISREDLYRIKIGRTGFG